MTRNGHRLLGLLGLVLVVACDDGGAAKTEAKKAAAPPAKTAAPSADPPAATPRDAPTKVAAADPIVEPTPSEPTPSEPTPSEAADGGDAPAEPAADDPGEAPGDVVPPDEGDDDDDDDASAGSGSGSAMVATAAEVNGITLGEEAELLRLVLAHDVVDRQPVDPAVSFPAGQKVSLFIEARNESSDEQSVQVTWEVVSSGRRSPPSTVAIPTRKLHRTRAYRTMKKPGEYRCIVLGADDRELAVIPFTIE